MIQAVLFDSFAPDLSFIVGHRLTLRAKSNYTKSPTRSYIPTDKNANLCDMNAWRQALYSHSLRKVFRETKAGDAASSFTGLRQAPAALPASALFALAALDSA